MILALTRAPASALAPFDYSSLIWAAILGVVIFDETLPPMTLIGLVLAVAMPALAAWLLGLALFKGRGLFGAYFGIVTLAAAVIAERLAINWGYIGGFNGLLDVPPLL